MKNPTIATLLNIIPGLGYLYLGGQRRILGIALTASVALSIIASFDPLLYSEEYMNAPFRFWDVLSFIGLLLILSGFTYDAYVAAVDQNARLSKQKK